MFNLFSNAMKKLLTGRVGEIDFSPLQKSGGALGYTEI
jgi:hypothetical protein